MESFGSCSSLRASHEKTEILALGNSILHEKDLNNHRVCEIIKILGVHFGYDKKQRNNINFRQKLQSIKKLINMWKWRNFSLLGKIQIIRTFAIPKLMFRASVIPISNDLGKEANSIFYFIWNGNDKVKHCALISDIDKGGLKTLDMEPMVSARRVIRCNKFLEDYAKKQTPPAQPKIIDNYSEASIKVYWYSLHSCTTLDSKLREFQYTCMA